MEFMKTEIAEIERIEAEKNEDAVRDLTEMQLALIGGGIGNVALG